jgi:hypothetical protein
VDVYQKVEGERGKFFTRDDETNATRILSGLTANNLVLLDGARGAPKTLIGKPVTVVATLTSVKGGKATFDLRSTQGAPYDCHETSRVSRIDPNTGRVEYEEACKFRPVAVGYLVTAAAPARTRTRSRSLASSALWTAIA